MKYLKAFIGVIILTALDQWSKYMVLIHVKPVGSIPLIKNILSFTYHETVVLSGALCRDRFLCSF